MWSAELEVTGVTVIPGALSPAQCDEWGAALERLVESSPGSAELMQEAGRPGATAGMRSAGRTAVVLHLFNKARPFEQAYQIAPVMRLVRRFLGADAGLSNCEGRVRLAGSPAQRLHADASLTGPNKDPAPLADRAAGRG